MLISCKHWSIADKVSFEIKLKIPLWKCCKNRFMSQLFFHPDVKPFRSLMSTQVASIASSYVLSTSFESLVLLKHSVCLIS